MKIFSFVLLCLSGRPHRMTLIFKKTKNSFLSLSVSVRSPAPCDTYFLKNTKNNFLSLLVSVRPLASYDTYFQVIQKYKKKIQYFQSTKISTFSSKKSFFNNYVILDSPL